MKQIVFLFALLLLPLAASADAVEIDGIFYNLNPETKEAELTKNPNKYAGNISIPSSVFYAGVNYNVTSIGDFYFLKCNDLASITIPNSVTSIGDFSFYECSGLTSVIIPNSVTSIGQQAFYDCTGLTSIIIPISVTKIGVWNFLGCINLASIRVESGNTVYDSRDNCNAIIVTNRNALFAGCKNTVIPNTVTSIEYHAFQFCSTLKSIVIPNSVWLIGENAFDGCSSLSSITIPSSVTSIETFAFANCNGLTSITIPNSVKSIGWGAFRECSSLTSVKSLIKTPFDIDESVFSDSYTSATLYVPAGTKAKYEATDGWKEFKNIVEMEAQDLEPVDGGEDISFGGADSEIDEETDLDGNVVGNVLYNIQPDNGQYNPVEGCIEVTKPMTDEEMEDLEGKDVFGEDVHDNYTGIVFKVPAGSGTITVEADALGAMTLKVKIGKQEPIELIPVGKMKMKIPYTVDKPTYIYIYAGMMDPNAARGQNRAAATPKLKLYGIGMESTSGITETMAASPTESVYAIGGQRLATRQRGLNIVRMSDGTVRKIVAK